MAAPIHGQLDGISQDSQGLQEVSDTQAEIMHSLASTMEGLSTTLRGGAGAAMQNVGNEMHTQGMRFSSTFADHSQKMSNNGAIFDGADQDHANMINQVSNLIP